MQSNLYTLFSIGANLGNRSENILSAIELLKSSEALTHINISSLYETEPVGNIYQPLFLNAAISGLTSLPIFDLIQLCKSIEYSIGRISRTKWSEREIDIDILLYGSQVIDNEKITIPHPLMHKRRFVLVPAAEIAGDIIHSRLGKTIKKLLDECEDNAEVKFITHVTKKILGLH